MNKMLQKLKAKSKIKADFYGTRYRRTLYWPQSQIFFV